MRKGFAALLLCGPLVLSGCAESDTQVAEPVIEKLESQVNIATSSPEQKLVPMPKLQDCKFNGKKLTGKVYFTDNSNLRDNSTVYIGPEPKSNLVIKETTSSLDTGLSVYLNSSGVLFIDSGKCGVWEILDSPLGADWVVYLTDDPFVDADITVRFVSESIFAGRGGL